MFLNFLVHSAIKVAIQTSASLVPHNYSPSAAFLFQKPENLYRVAIWAFDKYSSFFVYLKSFMNLIYLKMVEG